MLTTLEEKLDSRHTALLVVDMQNDFCAPGGFVDHIGGDLAPVSRVADRIRDLLEAARASGTHVVHIRSWFDEPYLNEPMRERLQRFEVPPYCVSGTWGVEFVKGLEPANGEDVINKHRYSGFYGTPLDIRLAGRGIRSVVVCGTATNNCVDGTGRDAFYNGYYVVLPSDSACAPSEALHDHALATAAHGYALIPAVEQVVGIWRGGAGRG